MAGIIFAEGTGLNDSVYGKSQAPIKAMIEQNVEAFEKQSMIDKIYYMDTTTHYAEKYTSETSMGDFEDVGENGAYPLTSIQEGYSKTIEPTTWKSRFEVTQEMIEDANMGKIKSRANMFSLSYNRTREKFAADLLIGGLGTTVTIGKKKYNTTSADGKALFATDHPSKTQGAKLAQSNLFKYTATSDNFTDVLDAAQENMQDFRDDDGNLLTVAPDTIIIPNSGAMKRKVFEAVASELDPNSSNNAFNFQIGLWNVLVWNYLPKTVQGKEYFLLMDSKFNQDYMCLPWLDRVKLTVKSAIDDNTDANTWSGRARFGAGFNNWRGIALVGDSLTNGTEL